MVMQIASWFYAQWCLHMSWLCRGSCCGAWVGMFPAWGEMKNHLRWSLPFFRRSLSFHIPLPLQMGSFNHGGESLSQEGSSLVWHKVQEGAQSTNLRIWCLLISDAFRHASTWHVVRSVDINRYCIHTWWTMVRCGNLGLSWCLLEQ